VPTTPGTSVRGRLFDVWSAVYDAPAVQAAIYRPVHDVVFERLWDARPAVVLDVGCGTGLLTTRLAGSIGARLVAGCDLSAGMLQQAAGRSRTARWLQGDAMQLPLRGGSVDAVLSTESFHWIPDQGAAVAEVHRVLRPGGLLLIGMVTPRTRLAGRLAAAGAQAIGQQPHWPTPAELDALLGAAGFDRPEHLPVRRVGSALVPTRVVVARRR
jgi:ubiquinone/menaquinone biosynthesis C-methylase UbiE